MKPFNDLTIQVSATIARGAADPPWPVASSVPWLNFWPHEQSLS
jgi:hypothetical protein